MVESGHIVAPVEGKIGIACLWRGTAGIPDEEKVRRGGDIVEVCGRNLAYEAVVYIESDVGNGRVVIQRDAGDRHLVRHPRASAVSRSVNRNDRLFANSYS